MTTYTLIAYKPDSANYRCRCCPPDDRYSSDFSLERGLDGAMLRAKMAALMATDLGDGEAGWDIEYFEDAPVPDENADDAPMKEVLLRSIREQAQAIADNLIRDRKEQERLKHELEQERQAAEECRADLKRLADLKAKYPDR